MKQMKEQDLFEDFRDDSVLEYLHDYQEKYVYPLRSRRNIRRSENTGN